MGRFDAVPPPHQPPYSPTHAHAAAAAPPCTPAALQRDQAACCPAHLFCSGTRSNIATNRSSGRSLIEILMLEGSENVAKAQPSPRR